ncbi:MAG: heme lyase CcmF/NrfE family subunit, partial [Firmicutes bacterium]|nr:heme lyase CcmF/NrfE family subunit [Bacillota bacterium]
MSIPAVGHLALWLALVAAVYAALAGGWSFRSGNLRLAESARGATAAAAVALTVAVLVLEDLLVTGDYGVQAVYNHVDRALPLVYRIGALWGGDSGSVLFWGWLLSLYAAYLAVRHWPREVRLTPAAVPVLAAILVFFAGLSAVVVNPFAPVPGHPSNGVGLDPLLQNLVMTL